VVPGPTAPAGKSQRDAWKREVRREYFKRLKELVGLFTYRHVELEVLQRGKFPS